MKNYTIAFLILFTSFSACRKQSNSYIVLGKSFNLTYDEQKSTSDDAISVHFKEVIEDSRCPRYVECVWEGQVKVKLRVETENINPEDITLTYRSDNHEDIARDTLDDMVFILENVLPERLTLSEIPQKDYMIKMRIEEL